MNIQTVTSTGGIEAWLVQAHAVPMLALRFAFDGGSSQDLANKGGLANFLAEMLGQGAGDMPALAFQERVRDIAAHLSFGAGMDAFSGSLDTLTESRDEAVQLLKLALTSPRFDADALERVRRRIAVAITRAAREPDKVAGREWNAVAFAGHAYAQPPSGTAATVGKITSEDLEVYRKRVLARDTLKVVAVGDITPDQLATLLDEAFGSLPAKADLTPIAPTNPTSGGRLAIIDLDVPQSAVAFGIGAVPRTDPDYMPAVVLNHIIGGGGFASRLMEEVRVKRGLAYSVSTTLAPSRYASVLRGRVATRNEMVAQSLDIIRDELQKLAEGQISQRDLDGAKSYLVGSYPLRFDANAKIAGQLLGLRMDGLAAEHVDNRNVMIEAVSLEDLKRVAKRLFDRQELIVAVAGRPEFKSQASDRWQAAKSSA
jgi:zinc protease